MFVSKYAVFEHILKSGGVQIDFDANVQGVYVPQHLAGQERVTLEFGFDERISRDLRFDPTAVSGSLNFGGFWLDCVVPWTAVYAMRRHDGMGRCWMESMPASVRADVKAREARSRLQVVLGGGQRTGHYMGRRLRVVQP